MLAGSYDPITPPADTERVAASLRNSTFVLVDPVGHGVTGFDVCTDAIAEAFLDRPRAAVDTSCVAASPHPISSDRHGHLRYSTTSPSS